MRTRTRLLGWLLPVLAAVVAASPIAGLAQPSGVDPDAIKVLRRSTDYVAGLKAFRVDTVSSLEIVTVDGQKLQFSHHVIVTVQRPNRMRTERVGDLISQIFYYDGKTLSVYLPEYRYYATVAAPPTIEAALDFARDTLDVVAPASDLVYSNAFEVLTDRPDFGVHCRQGRRRGRPLHSHRVPEPGGGLAALDPRGRQTVATKVYRHVEGRARVATVCSCHVDVGHRAQAHRRHVHLRASQERAKDRLLASQRCCWEAVGRNGS